MLRRTLLSLAHATAATVLCSALHGQAAVDPAASPSLTIELAGPDAWRIAFERTRLGRLLADPRMMAPLAPVRAALATTGWQRRIDLNVEPLRGDLERYGGVVVITATAPELTPETDTSAPFACHGSFVGFADGHSDLDKIALRLRELCLPTLGRASPPAPHTPTLRQLRIDGRPYALTDPFGERGVTLPVFEDGRLIAAFGQPLEEAVRRGMARARSLVAPKPAANLVLRAYVELAQLQRALPRQVAACGNLPREWVAALDDLGLATVQGVEIRIRAEGERLVFDVRLTIEPSDRPTLFAALQPDATAADLRRLPTDADFGLVAAVRWDRLYLLARQAWTRAWLPPPTADDIEANLTRAIGMPFREFVATLGDELRVSAQWRLPQGEGIAAALALSDPDAARGAVAALAATPTASPFGSPMVEDRFFFARAGGGGASALASLRTPAPSAPADDDGLALPGAAIIATVRAGPLLDALADRLAPNPWFAPLRQAAALVDQHGLAYVRATLHSSPGALALRIWW